MEIIDQTGLGGHLKDNVTLITGPIDLLRITVPILMIRIEGTLLLHLVGLLHFLALEISLVFSVIIVGFMDTTLGNAQKLPLKHQHSPSKHHGISPVQAL